MEGAAPDVEVYRSTEARAVRERALVLRARGIAFRSVREAGGEALRVHPANVELAQAELEAYDEENVGWPPAEGAPQLLSRGVVGALTWVAALFLVFSLERAGAAGLPWWEAGRGEFAAVRSGEWWRAVTSLTLHVDIKHLLSNAVFGSLFVVLLAQLLGAGLAALAVVTGGMLGNLLNAYVRSEGFAGVGASTAVFAAVGLLVALEWLRLRRLRHRWIRRWAPVLAGLVFLGYLGTSGERTDVLAHATGWVAGVAVGLFLPVPEPERLGSLRVQSLLGAATVALLVGAWWVALATT